MTHPGTNAAETLLKGMIATHVLADNISVEKLKREWEGDWDDVLKYADSDCYGIDGSSKVTGFKPEDISTVYLHAKGENDSEDWIAVFGLKDGRFASVRAGCDYTGWGCQESGRAYIAPSLPDILAFGLTDAERTRLGVIL